MPYICQFAEPDAVVDIGLEDAVKATFLAFCMTSHGILVASNQIIQLFTANRRVNEVCYEMRAVEWSNRNQTEIQ